jgi:hypothetical protein
MKRRSAFAPLAVLALGCAACSRGASSSVFTRPGVDGGADAAIVELVDPCDGPVVASLDSVTVSLSGSTWTETFPAGGRTDFALDGPPRTTARVIIAGRRGGSSTAPVVAGASAPIDLSIGRTVPVAVGEIGMFHRERCDGIGMSRIGESVQALSADGPVLIVGGEEVIDDGSGPVLGDPNDLSILEAYAFDIATFEQLGDFPSSGSRSFHTASLIGNNRVLVAGGEARVRGAPEPLSSMLIVELDGAQESSIGAAASLTFARAEHTATLLGDARVLMIGGRDGMSSSSTLELYDPARDISTLLDATLAHARAGHSAFLLASGLDVVVGGGYDGDGGVASIELVHVEGDRATVTVIDGSIDFGPVAHAAAQLPSGELVFSGGRATPSDAETSATDRLQVWSIAGGIARPICAGAMSTGRSFHTLSIIGPSLVIAGGVGSTGAALDTAEWIDVSIENGSCTFSSPRISTLATARFQHRAVVSPERGELRLFGGRRSAPEGPTIGWIEVSRTLPF